MISSFLSGGLWDIFLSPGRFMGTLPSSVEDYGTSSFLRGGSWELFLPQWRIMGHLPFSGEVHGNSSFLSEASWDVFLPQWSIMGHFPLSVEEHGTSFFLSGGSWELYQYFCLCSLSFYSAVHRHLSLPRLPSFPGQIIIIIIMKLPSDR